MNRQEQKEHTPRRKEHKKNTSVYSDHCAIITEINWTEGNIERRRNNQYKIITEKSLQKINQNTLLLLLLLLFYYVQDKSITYATI